MKTKYIGLVGLTLVGVAVLVMAADLLGVVWNRVRPLGSGAGFASYSAERLLVDAAAVGQMDLVEPTLPRLVQPERIADQDVTEPVSGVNYSMFGERPPIVAAKAPSLPASKRSKPYPYRVSMTYLSGDHRYAVIDKKLYRQDARLPHGENLAEIAVGSVRIDSANGPRWISIQGGGK